MSKEKMDIAKKKCTTPKFRVSFPHVFKAKSFEDQAPKFSMTMLFDKTTDLKDMKRAVFNAAVEEWGSDKAKWPKKLRMPFRDGSEKSDLDGYEGKIFVGASSKNRPGVIAGDRSPIAEEDNSFYAGCYARATLIAFAYDKAGNVGVSFSLQNIQKMGDGKPFSGRKAAEDEFDSVEDESDDPSNYAAETVGESEDEYDI